MNPIKIFIDWLVDFALHIGLYAVLLIGGLAGLIFLIVRLIKRKK
uniref:Uncharacterized protein n=1 Tax=viral metagenome TaxID=1070528 RepID=A0A6M3L4T2_9ZZZZ